MLSKRCCIGSLSVSLTGLFRGARSGQVAIFRRTFKLLAISGDVRLMLAARAEGPPHGPGGCTGGHGCMAG